jgi:signal transduction histidine kinase
MMNVDSNDDFDLLNTFAHDLKTPLSAMKSYIDLVEQAGELSERQRFLLEKSLLAAERMERIINELLDYARLGAEKALHITDCALPPLVEDAVLFLEDFASRRYITIHLDLPANLSPVQGDARMLSHVFVNLVNNAIKYNRENGTIVIAARNEGKWVRVEVRDTGIGIAEVDLPRVFDRFFRVKPRRGEKIEGTGLGLSIVRAVVQKHGGQVSVTSKPGEGTTFSFTLPRIVETGGVDRARLPVDEERGGSNPVVFFQPESASEISDDMDDDFQESNEVKDPDSSHDGL